MKTKFSLPSGVTGFTREDGTWQATGSQMSRPNILPEDTNLDCKLRLTRLPFVDGAYDRWGAYWGSPANVWCAWGDCGEVSARVFVRADLREKAKQVVRSFLPGANFYR